MVTYFCSSESNTVSFEYTFHLRFWDAIRADVMRKGVRQKDTDRHQADMNSEGVGEIDIFVKILGPNFGLVLLTLTSDLSWFAGFVSAQGFTFYNWWSSRLKGLVVLMDDVWAPSCVFGFSF